MSYQVYYITIYVIYLPVYYRPGVEFTSQTRCLRAGSFLQLLFFPAVDELEGFPQ